MESSKVYVDVTAEFSKEGVLTPKSFRWTDIVNGRESYLYYEDNNMWFMERAGA